MTFFGVVCLLPLPAVASLRDTKANCGGTAVANSVGRLIEMNSSPANRRIHAFDAMGRVIRSRHVVNGTGGGAFKFTYLISGLRSQPELNGCRPFLKRR